MPRREPNGSAEAVAVPEEGTGLPRFVVFGQVLWRKTFSALRHRNFRLFFFGQIISLIGTWIQNTALGWLVYQITGSKLLLGAVAAASSAPMLLFSALGGSLADRHSKRTIVICTQTGMMMCAFVLAALVWTGRIHPWQILLLSALGGLAMSFDMPARQAFMVEMTSRQDLMNAISLNSSVVNGARVVGPSIAGLLMGQVGVAACFFLNGLSYLAVIAGLLMMRLPAVVRPQHVESAWSHAREGFAYVLGNGRLRRILILFGVVGVFGWSYAVLMPAFATDVLKVGQEQYGMLLSANGIGALSGALTVAAFGTRFAPRLLVMAGLWTFSGMLLLLCLVNSYYAALAFLAVAGWGMLLFFSTINTLLQTTSSDAMRGRVMGIWALVFGGMTPAGSLMAGTLSHYWGLRVTIGLGAVVCAVAGAVMLAAAKRRTTVAE